MAAVTTYVTDQEIEDFFHGLVPNPLTWVAADIPVLIRGEVGVSEGVAFSMIKSKLDYVWDDPITDTKILLLNGEGFDSVFVEAPITVLDSIEIINPDETEESLVVTGSTRQVYYDSATGKISLRRNVPYSSDVNLIDRGLDYYDGGVFPEGLENIRITGQFGAAVPAIVKMIEILNMYKLMQFQNPEVYKKAGNLVREQIGRYEYQLGTIGFDKNSKHFSLDAYIDYLYELLPKANLVDWGAI